MNPESWRSWARGIPEHFEPTIFQDAQIDSSTDEPEIAKRLAAAKGV
jgi:hypothetical protein